ncbi:UDP-glucosyltransferase 2-like [Colias croceus]|uniref:UDP-glucosyltransferase 2-like n=1 Tax=Colias crocea TaxID=72248 RepID=UPI001E2808C2|nr:UDP-glucosyltransferase 2-like [Colias croceus]
MGRLVKIILIISFVSKIDAAKILAVFPTPSISHQVVFRPLTQELARRGHEVTVITADPAFTKENAPANLTEIDFHDISYKTWKETFMNSQLQLGKRSSMVALTKTLIEMMLTMTEEQIKTKEMQELINDGNKKFDLIILESCARPYNIFSHIFKAPVIEVSSFGMFYGSEKIVGAPSHPFLYPTESNQKLFNLTFWEKVYELYTHVRINSLWSAALNEEMSLIRKLLGKDIPSHEELNKNTEFMFLNIHPVWSHNQPLPPNVISIWGMHKTPEKPLPKELENYLNSSKNGVVYVSFGSNVRSSLLPPRTVETLMGVFSKLPYDVLLKWDHINVPGLSSNVKVSTWLPQSDLLKHSKIKLFITQGGLQSTDEAINAGVPLVGIPMFGDQWYNVELYEYHKIGLKVDMENLTEDNLLKAIKTVIDDKSYRKNIIRLRNIMRDQPESALDRAVWWTEYVLRHGGAKHLRAAAANMPWTQYYEIEFILILGSIILIFAAAFLRPYYDLHQRRVKGTSGPPMWINVSTWVIS